MDVVDERTEERPDTAEGRFERAAERFRHAGALMERAAGRLGQAEGTITRPERAGAADGSSGRPANDEREIRMDLLAREMDRLSTRLERAKIAEYVELLNRPLSLVWRNFVGGMARGIGIAIGFTFFAATILYVLQLLGKLNLPIIGDYIADIVRIVQRQLEGRTY
jgi:hypothetical protein